MNVIAAAYSLVGEVGYFWGGKSTVIGNDPGWGTAEKVSAAGSPSTGTTRAYGLDCSGFVTWAVINGYLDQSMQQAVGDGTSDQWLKANVVSEQDAQPGDLVFQRGPEAGSDNHVGIICGKTDSGDWIAVHCSSSKNGVTVGEAYGASFRYIRQPSFYPTEEELTRMLSEGAAADNAEMTETAETSEETSGTASSEFSDSGITVGSAGIEQTDTEQSAAGNNDGAAENNSDIEVIFDDMTDGETLIQDSEQAEITSTGNAEVTESLQNILEQNTFVSGNAADTFPEETEQSDPGEIEVTFQN